MLQAAGYSERVRARMTERDWVHISGQLLGLDDVIDLLRRFFYIIVSLLSAC